MDALIYTAMSGAERALHAQQVHANNLANLDTPGFRANMELATSQAVKGATGTTRAISAHCRPTPSPAARGRCARPGATSTSRWPAPAT